jgi:hypothetical protein
MFLSTGVIYTPLDPTDCYLQMTITPIIFKVGLKVNSVLHSSGPKLFYGPYFFSYSNNYGIYKHFNLYVFLSVGVIYTPSDPANHHFS